MMNSVKQVDRSHYNFRSYMSRARWASIWHQVDEVLKFEPHRVLEIGPGPGIFKAACGVFGIGVETLDVDPELSPDYVGSAVQMPFAPETYDVVCAFQMLEHLPYEQAVMAFSEMARVSRRAVIISLPDSERVWPYRFHIPKLGPYDYLMKKPGAKPQAHVFDGEHYWEVNKRGHLLSNIANDLGRYCDLQRTYRVFENPSHRFFVFTKPGTKA